MAKYININYPKITIYCLVSEDEPENIRYVGVTRRLPNYRLSNHIYDAKKYPNKNNKTKWISSVGFKVKQIILDVIEEKDVIFWEQYWISQIKSWGFDLDNSNNGGGGLNKRDNEFSSWLSNRSKGNKYNLGKTHSDEAKYKMSIAKLGKPSPRKGIVVSEETKKLMGLRKLGKIGNANGFKHSEEFKIKKRKIIIQTDLDNNFIREWNSVTDIGKHFNVTISVISKILKKENKTYKNFIWLYKNINNG